MRERRVGPRVPGGVSLMLAAVDIRLAPASDARAPHPCGHQVHAALLAAVNRVDRRAASELHRDAQVKPFSVSTLWPRMRVQGDVLEIPGHTECRIRLATLDRPTFEAFSSALMPLAAVRGSLVINGTDYIVQDVGMCGRSGGAASWSDLCAREREEYALKFVSPTAFRRRGLNVPLPDPQLVLGSLWQRWEAFSTEPFSPQTLEELTGCVALSVTDIHTRVWRFPRYMMVGFVGIAAFRLTGRPSRDALRLFNGLMNLAPFSGVGYKTTMGMGQCFLVERDDARRSDEESTECEI